MLNVIERLPVSIPLPGGAPRDGEAQANLAAMMRVVERLAVVKSVEEAINTVLESVKAEFDWAYGSYWRLDPEKNALVFAQDVGEVTEKFMKISQEAEFKEGVGLSGRAWRARDIVAVEDLGELIDCCRREAAQEAGVKSGVCFPIVVHGQVCGTMDFFMLRRVRVSKARLNVLRCIGQMLSGMLERFDDQAAQMEVVKDGLAIGKVLMAVSEAKTPEEAMHKALNTVCETFGWIYGSYWVVNPEEKALRFSVQTGVVNPEFEQITRTSSFLEGVGLNGRAWARRDLMFVEDLGEMVDCCRREAAQRVGVKSGIAFPVMMNGQVLGTMDFFTDHKIKLSDNRAAALRNVSNIISSTFEKIDTAYRIRDYAKQIADYIEQLNGISNSILQDAEHSSNKAQGAAKSATEVSSGAVAIAAATEELNASVSEISRNMEQSKRVSDNAKAKAHDSQRVMDQLSASAEEVSKVIDIIREIANETNVLALNAAIEAARAGDVGKGFAVVAQKVKQLAQQTNSASEGVKDRIQVMQQSNREAGHFLEDINSVIDQLSSITEGVAAAVQQQAAASMEISQTVADSASASKEISNSITTVCQLAQDTSEGVRDAKVTISKLATLKEELVALIR